MSSVLNIGRGETKNEVFVLRSSKMLPFSKITLEADSSLELTVVVMPGVSVDVPLCVELNGEGAQASIHGVYVCGTNERVNFSIDMVHNVPNALSRQLLKGVVGGNAKVDFYGKIYVARDAQKTEAYQENHNILLTDGAKVYTKPQLEIYADDVKCTHGATVGNLDEEEQFYMRSRGLSLEQAKLLQTVSFLSPALVEIDESKREEIVAEIETAVLDVIGS